jgi:hypothetical protein
LALGLQNLVIAEGRYRKPLEPLLLLNLVWIVAGAYRRKSQKNNARAEESTAAVL